MIIVKDLEKTHQQGDLVVRALRGVSCKIDDGEFVSITGPSGSGKSTFLYILGLMDFPTKGIVLFEGVDTSKMGLDEAAAVRLKKSGYVFQFHSLFGTLTAVENVMIPALLLGTPYRKSRQKATDMLQKVGLGARVDHLPTQMSGGEQQRVAIARALINDPKVIFADEPTASLDTANSLAIFDLFSKLNKDGQTIVMVTHEMYLAKKAKRLITLRDGQIVSSAKRKG